MDAIREAPLRDFSAHVGILVLHRARHNAALGIQQGMQFVRGGADKALHQRFFRQTHRLHRVCGEEAVLDVHEGRLGLLRHAPTDQRKITRLLRIAGEEHAPTHIRHTHHIVVPRMDIQRMAGERPRTNVEDHRQALATDDVEHFLHQD